MNKLSAIIRREFIERVRTKAFIIGTLLVPVMMLVFGYLPSVLMNQDTRARNIALVDASTGTAGDSIAAVLRRLKRGTGAEATARVNLVTVKSSPADLIQVRDTLIAHVDRDQEGSLDGILVVTDGGVDSGLIRYYGANVASFKEMNALENAISPVVRVERLIRLGADSALIAAAAVRFNMQTDKVTKGRLTGESGESSFFLAYITALVMYFSLIMYGIQVMGAVLEEKSNRIVEVLISSVTPFQMMLGKVIGVAGAGLLQLAIWGMAAVVGMRAVAQRSMADAVAVDGSQQSLSASGAAGGLSPELVVIVLIFFLLGFVLYSALYAAVGSMCSSQQETQQAAQPVTITLAIGFIMMFAMINDPGSTLARTISFVPFFSPMIIPVRYAISPLPLIEVLGAILSTALGVVAVVWVAGRIYRIGILSYGKKPTFKELWAWIRTT
ncbi:MAG TPA: ABC transporter permease [Gemmatimonadales bacterium]|nr:ABC transporter permease [Gemmatimonadales bacterium]